jgi:hypothetical protein
MRRTFSDDSRDGAEVLDGLAVVRFVDHRGKHHQPVEPDLLGVARELASQGSGVLGDSSEDGDAPAHHLFHLAKDFELLVIFKSGILTDRSEEDQAVDAGLNHRFEMLRGSGQIQGLVRAKLSCDSGEYTPPVNFHLCLT